MGFMKRTRRWRTGTRADGPMKVYNASDMTLKRVVKTGHEEFAPVSRPEIKVRKQVTFLLPGLRMFTNYRPTWLRGMELDIFFPELSLGIEVNGPHHNQALPWAGLPLWQAGLSRARVEAQRRRDRYKANLCKRNHVMLLVIDLQEKGCTSLSYLATKLDALGVQHKALVDVDGRDTLKAQADDPMAPTQ